MATALTDNLVGFHPIPLPPSARIADISAFPVDRTRNAVNQGGVGGYNNGSNWRQNPTTYPFTTQPGPVYGVALNCNQPYRATAGWHVVIASQTPGITPARQFAQQPMSGGVRAAAQLQQRVAALIAMRARTASTRGPAKS